MSKRTVKISREELEKDEVLEFTDKAIFFLRLHGNKILAALAAVLLVYAVMVIIRNNKERVLRAGSDKLYGATLLYEKSVREKQWGTPERTEAMKQVAAAADEIFKEYAGSAIARNALFLKANAYYYAGDGLGTTTYTEEAIKYFTEYLALAEQQGDGFEQAGALLALGYCNENLSLLTGQKNPEASRQALVAAVDFYDRITKLADAGFLRYEAMNAKARILADRGQVKEAIELYKQVVREHFKDVPIPPDDASAREIEKYQLRMITNQVTTGSTARIALLRLGVDSKEIEALTSTEAES